MPRAFVKFGEFMIHELHIASTYQHSLIHALTDSWKQAYTYQVLVFSGYRKHKKRKCCASSLLQHCHLLLRC